MAGMSKPSFSEPQTKMAWKLFEGPKTLEELAKETGLSMDSLHTEIKQLLSIKVLEKKEGFPTRYALLPGIQEELERRKEVAEQDKFSLRVHAIIETQAIEPVIIQKQTGKYFHSLFCLFCGKFWLDCGVG